MNTLNSDALLKEISSELPCGEDLEYDSAFIELCQEAQGKAEQQVGDAIIQAQEPAWRAVQKQAIELLSQTKDIRILTILIQAALHNDGFYGLRDGLSLLRNLLEQHWDNIHPELDKEDNNDPTMRINALATLYDGAVMLQPVRTTALVRSRVMGAFSMRDIAVASGEITPTGDTPPPEMSAIDAAFMEAGQEQLQETNDAITESIEQLQAIEKFVTDQVGSDQATSFSALVQELRHTQPIMAERLARHGVTCDPGETEENGNAGSDVGAATGATLSGEINSRKDVIRAMEKIEQYYKTHESSSPVPLLIARAKKLVPMDFIDIIQNLAPDGMSQVETIRGPEGEENNY